MFRAMQQGKAGRTTLSLEAGSPVRHLFRHTEDFLTSTVFERLSYLPGALAWDLLCDTFAGLHRYRMVDVIDVAFWPRWPREGADGETEGKFVEPDIVLTLDLGDPARRTVMIIEVKTAGIQSAEQWTAQLRAARALEDHENAALIFAALDDSGRAAFPGLCAKLDPALRERVQLVHGDWRDLGLAVAKATVADPGTRRLLADVEEALALYGYHTTILNDALLSLPKLADPDAALAALTRGWTP